MIIWLASYPKSGNTWLRSLISAYYYSKDGIFLSDKQLDYIPQFPVKKDLEGFDYNLNSPGDASRFWIAAQEKINTDKKIKFFKTHNALVRLGQNNFTNKKNTLGCIYIVRDPRNVLNSMSRHFQLDYEKALGVMQDQNNYTYDFKKKNDYSDFQFISSWEKNYQSWKNNKIFPIKFIRYEDLNKETFKVFKSVIEFISIISKDKKSFNREKAINSINSTSFETLKSLEKKRGFRESVLSNTNKEKIPFFYLGPKNDWKKILNENIKLNLEKNFRQSLKDINYI